MPSVTIKLAETDAELEAVRELCREFVSWQLRTFPEMRTKIETYFGSAEWAEVLRDLSRLHARPTGAILLATGDGEPVGCIMYHHAEPGIAEVKRLFVRERERGTGIGRALVSEMLASAAGDGYEEVRLDTARFLTAAIGLYAAMGFREIEPPADLPSEIRDVAIFMERRI